MTFSRLKQGIYDRIQKYRSLEYENVSVLFSNYGLEAVTCLDQVGAYCGNEGGVALHNRWKAHSQFGLAESGSLEHHFRLLTPGNKEAVVFHPSNHVIYLLHGKPEESRMERKEPSAPSVQTRPRRAARQW